MENLEKEIKNTLDLFKSNKFSDAETNVKKLLEQNPKVPFLYNLLGLICAAQKKDDEAIMHYEKGISINPDYSMIYNNLGTIYKSKKDYIKSESYYKKSLKLNDKIPEAHNNLGNLYNNLNRHEEAIKCFDKSIKINSNFYIGHYNLGVLYKSIGKFEKSKKYFVEAIKKNPKFYNAHRAFSQINKYKTDDDHIKMMKKLYEDSNINFFGKMELAFALGKASDDIKNFDDAHEYYKEGNKFRRKNINFSIEKEIEEFSNIKKIFNSSFYKKYKKIGNENTSPIFILGMPRSGTTLIEQIISSHPKVFGGDELNYFNDLIKNFFYKDGNFSLSKVNNSPETTFKHIGKEYISNVKKISGKSLKFTDKLPINFKWIGFIKVIFPKAKVIHCTRNSKDICVSIFKNYFTNTELNYAYDIDELINFYNLYADLMNFWKKSLSEFIFEIKYENLIFKPKKEIYKLIKNCDLSWNENCIKFYNNKRAVKTASDSQIRNKIYSTSIDSWKNYEKYFSKNFRNLKF
tara:strand:+ start:707 stop:2260 length:1554 start_codon:yes stop_codon:yes gene_type:complete